MRQLLSKHATASFTALLTAFGALRLPPGLCYGDSGDLQAASIALGIAHPPGYAAFAAAGWAATGILPLAEPAWAVSFACLVCTAFACAATGTIVRLLGVPAALAYTLAVGLALIEPVWRSMIAPEVYGPSFALLAATLLALLRYAENGRRRHLVAASLLYGLLVASRPPSLLYAVGFAVAILVTRRPGWRAAGASVCLAAVPVAAVFALVVARDVPGNAYDYMEHFASSVSSLPGRDDLADRIRRAAWLMSCRQFHALVGLDAPSLPSTLRGVGAQLGVGIGGLGVLAGTLALGAAALFRRQRAAAVCAATIVLAQIAYLLTIHVAEQALDVLPLVLGASLVVGGCAAPALRTVGPRARTGCLAALTVVTAAVCATRGVDWRSDYGRQSTPDAEPYLATLDLGALPPRGVVLADWQRSTPLRGALLTRVRRPDLDIVTVESSGSLVAAWRFLGERPVFLADAIEAPEGWRLQAEAGLQRVAAWPSPHVVLLTADEAARGPYLGRGTALPLADSQIVGASYEALCVLFDGAVRDASSRRGSLWLSERLLERLRRLGEDSPAVRRFLDEHLAKHYVLRRESDADHVLIRAEPR